MARGSSSIGLRLDLSQKSVSGTIARIYAADAACQAGIREATHSAGEFCKALTAYYARKRTGYMSQTVRTVYTPDGFSFETGWLASDFTSAGQPFYPPYQEFGTRFMPAQPSLYPAYKETQEYYREELRATIRETIARQRARGIGGPR